MWHQHRQGLQFFVYPYITVFFFFFRGLPSGLSICWQKWLCLHVGGGASGDFWFGALIEHWGPFWYVVVASKWGLRQPFSFNMTARRKLRELTSTFRPGTVRFGGLFQHPEVSVQLYETYAPAMQALSEGMPGHEYLQSWAAQFLGGWTINFNDPTLRLQGQVPVMVPQANFLIGLGSRRFFLFKMSFPSQVCEGEKTRCWMFLWWMFRGWSDISEVFIALRSIAKLLFIIWTSWATSWWLQIRILASHLIVGGLSFGSPPKSAFFSPETATRRCLAWGNHHQTAKLWPSAEKSHQHAPWNYLELSWTIWNSHSASWLKIWTIYGPEDSEASSDIKWLLSAQMQPDERSPALFRPNRLTWTQHLISGPEDMHFGTLKWRTRKTSQIVW